MQVSQFHSPAPIPPEKGGMGGLQSSSGDGNENKIPCSCRESNANHPGSSPICRSYQGPWLNVTVEWLTPLRFPGGGGLTEFDSWPVNRLLGGFRGSPQSLKAVTDSVSFHTVPTSSFWTILLFDALELEKLRKRCINQDMNNKIVLLHTVTCPLVGYMMYTCILRIAAVIPRYPWFPFALIIRENFYLDDVLSTICSNSSSN
jgi:hypothetical protein